MRPLTLAAAALAVAATVPATAPAVAGPAHGPGHGHRQGHHGPGHHHGTAPSSYLLDPAGPAADDIFPEGIAVDGRSFLVGSTTDGTIYRGDLKSPTAVPFLAGGQDGRTSATGLKAERGKLFVSGAATGRFFVYDIRSRTLEGSFQVSPAPSSAAPSFINDVVVTKDGSAYITDSQRPVLYRVGPRDYRTDGVETLEVFRDFTGSALTYTPGFNVNGIEASKDGRYLVLAKSNSADLYRVRVSDGEVTRIDLGGEAVSGDGLVLKGRTLYAAERAGDVGRIVTVRLSHDLTSGRVQGRFTDPSFNDPTTAALARNRLLVVNSQFGERAAGVTPGPFTVSSIRVP